MICIFYCVLCAFISAGVTVVLVAACVAGGKSDRRNSEGGNG